MLIINLPTAILDDFPEPGQVSNPGWGLEQAARALQYLYYEIFFI